MEKPQWLAEAQFEEIWNTIFAAMRDVVVVDQTDVCRQVIRNHQQPLVMFEEVRNAILLV